MNVLRFSTNTAERVALKFDDGKPVSGKYGDQTLFTLVDGRVMYLPVAVAERIKELGIPKGQTFELVKREVTKDSKRFLEWEVTRLGDGPEESPEPASFNAAHAERVPAASNGSKLAVIRGKGDAALNGKLATAAELVDVLKMAVSAAAAAEAFAK